MAVTRRVSVTMGDKTHQTANVSFEMNATWLSKLLDPTKRDELKAILEANSYAKAIKFSDTETEHGAYPADNSSWWNLLAGVNIGCDLVDQKAVLSFRETVSGDVHTLQLPAPVKSMFEYVDGQGLRVKKAVGAAIATKLTEIFGTDVQFMGGHHKGKR